jgi:hypothetical protein
MTTSEDRRNDSKPDRKRRWRWLPLVIVFLPVILAFGVLWLVLRLAAAFVLLVAVWIAWCPRGRNALVVYSNSPIWQAWFEARALPTLGSRAVVLNWSKRKQWQPSSLAVLLFRVFGGSENFNPIVIVFTPLRLPRTFRFFRAFQDFKHGKPQEVERMWSEVMKAV